MSISEIIRSKPDYIGSCGRTNEEIAKCEEALGLRFANDYKEYLFEIGLACFDGRELTGICSSKRLDVVAATIEARKNYKNISDDCYVVESTGFESIIILQNSAGSIFQLDLFGNRLKIAESLAEYINQ